MIKNPIAKRFAAGAGFAVFFLSFCSRLLAQCEVWQPVGLGLNGTATCVTVYQNEIVVGGIFTQAGGVPASFVARWNGTAWFPLGSGISGSGGEVSALTVFNGDLIASGTFTSAGGINANSIARWNGSAWQTVGSELSGHIASLSVYDGQLISGSGFPSGFVGRWNGVSWQSLGDGLSTGARALQVFNGELVAGGDFLVAGGQPVQRIARWNGSIWQPLPGIAGGENFRVIALTTYGSTLIGGFGGTPVIPSGPTIIASWDGSEWQGIGRGIPGNNTTGDAVVALTTFNGDLVAGGFFNNAGGIPVNNIARWNGSSWQAMGSGTAGNNGVVRGLVALNGELFAAGQFITAGGQGVHHIARWVGPSWNVASSGAFSDGPNWKLGSPPAAQCYASFGATAATNSFTVTFTSSMNNTRCYVRNQHPIFDFGGFQYSLSDQVMIGDQLTASLALTNGTLTSPIITIGSFGTLSGDATVIGDISNAGALHPGMPTGQLSLLGDYAQSSSGVLDIAIAPNSSGLLAASGDISVNGTLKVQLMNGADPQSGQTLPILSAGGSLTGQFNALLLPYLGPDRLLNVQYQNGSPLAGVGGGVTIVIGKPDGNPDFGGPQEPVVINGEPTGLTGADVGSLPAANDIAMSIRPPIPTDPGTVLVLINQSNGTSFTPVIETVGLLPSGIVAAKLAGGANDDLAVTNQGDNNVTILFNAGGTFIPLNVAVGNAPSAITAGNFRGAAGGNLIDLAVTNQNDNTVTILINNGNSTFTAMPPVPVGGQPKSIATAQLVGDLLPDLVIANFASDTITILQNQGAGVFSNGPLLPSPNGPVTVDPSDVDNDRDIDIVVSTATAHSIAILINLGAGQFAPAVNLPVNGSPGSLTNWDMDSDGDFDLVTVVNDDTLGQVTRILRNDTSTSGGTLAFTLFDPIGAGEEPRLVRGTDVTGDKADDLIAVNVIVSPLAGGPPASSMAVRPNLIPPPPSNPGDITGNGVVNVDDLLAVINSWGPCPRPCPPRCSADIAPPGGNCQVNVDDLLMVINNWG